MASTSHCAGSEGSRSGWPRRSVALPYDESVADRLADLLAAARTLHRPAGAMDAIIAASALAHGLVVWTRDADFAVLVELSPQLRVHRG